MPSPQELELLRTAKLYKQYEEEKEVSQFNCIGREPMTKEETAAILRERERKQAMTELFLRIQDRDRAQCSKQYTHVDIPQAIHPFAAEKPKKHGGSSSGMSSPSRPASATGATRSPTTKVAHSAVEQVAARKRLLETFVQLARNCLLTQRVRRRISKAMMYIKGEQEQSNKVDSENIPRLSFITFPAMSSSSSSALAIQPNSAPGKGGKGREAAGGKTAGAAGGGGADEDIAAASKVERHSPFDLKEPFHFKEMGYSAVVFPSHLFMNVDKKYPSEILSLGHEVPTEENFAPLSKNLQVGRFECPVTASTPVFSTQPFSFIPTCCLDLFPTHVPPQQETSARITPPYYPYHFGQEQRLPWSTYTRNLNSQLLYHPLPTALWKGRQEDELSDSENEEGEQVMLDVKHPKSLKEVCEVFGEGAQLLQPAATTTTTTTATVGRDVEFKVPEKPVNSYDQEIKNPDVNPFVLTPFNERVKKCLTPRHKKTF